MKTYTLVRYYTAKEGRIFEAEDLVAAKAMVPDLIADREPDFDEVESIEDVFIVDDVGIPFDLDEITH
jgi:hypothetical protein